jgi:hypothetical protein
MDHRHPGSFRGRAPGEVVPDSPRGTILLGTINAKWIHPSLALRLLKANLGEYEGLCEIAEFALRQNLTEKTAPILALSPRILGLSVSLWNHGATEELLSALDRAWTAGPVPRPRIVLGGPEVSYLPDDSAIFRFAHWVIRGEGEQVFRDLVRLLLSWGENTLEITAGLEGLPSVEAVRGKFIRARRLDLTLLASPYGLYRAEDLARKLVYVESSRGCPFGCDFCLSPAESSRTSGPPVREFPLDSFLGEMEKLIQRGAEKFKFLDRTFNLDIDRAVQVMEFFLKKIEERTDPPGKGLCVHFEMVPSRLPGKLLKTLSRFPRGSLRLELGVQTLNPETAALVNRAGDPDKDLEALSLLRKETQAIIHADLIAGLPGEDLASFGGGFDSQYLPRKTPPPGPWEIQPGILKLLPGAAMSRHTGAWGMRYSPEPPYEVLETSALSRAGLDRLKNFARFWELIVNRGKFPAVTGRLFPPGEAVFDPFMALSDRLLAHFGRNWGIDKGELEREIAEAI